MPISKSMSSPLRYPGSKASLVGYVSDLLCENYLEQCNFIEPYAGSSVVSIELLNQGIIQRAILIERDPLIFAFWKAAFCHPHDLMERIHQVPVTMETWNSFQKYRKADTPFDYPLLEMGLAGLFFNRTTFSGIMKAGPIGGLAQTSQYKIDCRFNKERIIKQIFDISQYRSNIEVHFNDAIRYMTEHRQQIRRTNSFIYVDPPYYEKGPALYRYWYNHDDHKQLSRFLLKIKTPWLVSYDDHSAIRKLYKNAPGLQEIYIDYSVANCRREQELLLSNLHIPPFKQHLLQIPTA